MAAVNAVTLGIKLSQMEGYLTNSSLFQGWINILWLSRTVHEALTKLVNTFWVNYISINWKKYLVRAYLAQRFRVTEHKMKKKTNNVLDLMGLCSSKERKMLKMQTNIQECHKVVNAVKKRTSFNRINLRKTGCQGGLFSVQWQSSVGPPRLRIEQKLSILRTERTRWRTESEPSSVKRWPSTIVFLILGKSYKSICQFCFR